MTPPQYPALPIDAISDQIVSELSSMGALVLSAPTGSGKTTQVPQILLRSGLDRGGNILVLQPRRLATRLVATRVADEMGTSLGDVVGYQTRLESRYGANTRILFLTEGLFLRRLLSDPQLTGIGTVIIDEFHERSLAADMSLGLCRQLRASGRKDLRLVVMSATLDAKQVAQWLGCNALEAQGRTYPVHIDYVADSIEVPLWERAARALQQWLDTGQDGHVLVFMPGSYEIRRCVELFSARWSEKNLEVVPLYGSLTPKEQDRAVAPSARRKIIVSTNVAETSITIDGIGCVIDAGLARVARFDPTRGVNSLLVERISMASAQQRAGRAGRTAPGACLRLWPRSESHARVQHDTPEVERVDLSEAVLQLAAMGCAATDFAWLDLPPTQRLTDAANQLKRLGALDELGTLTTAGRAMANIPAHPRLARLLSLATNRGVGDRAAVWAALISERDICLRPIANRYRTIPDNGWPSDLVVRESGLAAAARHRFDPQRCATLGLNAAACREVHRVAGQFLRLAKNLPGSSKGERSQSKSDTTSLDHAEDELLARCLLVAFADHVGLRRNTSNTACEMAGRRRVRLDRDSSIGDSPAFVAVELREVEASRADGGGVQTIASLATAIEWKWLAEELPEQVSQSSQLEWDADEKAVYQIDGRRFGALQLEQRRRRADDSEAAAQLIIDRVLEGSLQFDRWDETVESWLSRARCVAEWFPERALLSYEEDDLAVVIGEMVGTASRWGAVRQVAVLDHLRHALSWEDQQFVEKMAPERIQLPTGFGMRIVYTPGEPPRGRAKIQDLYDVKATPKVAGGRVGLLLEILAPNFRPAQITDDLPGFWKRTYPELKKELKRRYPKHEWR